MFLGDRFERAGLNNAGNGDEDLHGTQILFHLMDQALHGVRIANVADVVLDGSVG
nr:hypothetical protein [Kocuria sp. cx-455]